MKRVLIILTIIIIFLSSCRPFVYIAEREEKDVETWPELFDAWHQEMSRNYVFWSLDSPNGEWDQVYEESMERLKDCGKIGESRDQDLTAMRVFFDVTKDLSDGHLMLSLYNNNPSNQLSMTVLPGEINVYRELGYTDDEIFLYSIGEKSLNSFESEYAMEGLLTRMSSVFGLSGIDREFSDITDNEYFKKCGYTLDFRKFFAILLGVTHDDVLYLSLSEFLLYEYMNATENRVKELIEIYKELLKDDSIKGVIIDLRGNMGGYPSDMNHVLGPLISEDLKIGEIRLKHSDNRLSYSPWFDLVVSKNADKTFDKPIALLINKASASCSELSTLFLKAFREKYKTPLIIIGGQSKGATGAVDLNEKKFFYAGGFRIDPYIDQSFTSMTQVRYLDESVYEGKGITPDIPIPFDFSKLREGNDARLQYALNWMRENTSL